MISLFWIRSRKGLVIRVMQNPASPVVIAFSAIAEVLSCGETVIKIKFVALTQFADAASRLIKR